MFNNFFFWKLYRLWDNVGKYGSARQTAGDNIIRCKRLPGWISKATEAYSEYFLITSRTRVLLEKLTGFQLVKKLIHILWNPKVHYRISSARHLSLPWTRSIQSMSPSHVLEGPILILSSFLLLGLPSGLFSSGFPAKTCIHLPYYKLPYCTVVKIINFTLLCCMLRILRFNCCIIFQLQ